MTDKHINGMPDDLDPRVSAEYHRLVNESAPEGLNHAVMEAARKNAGKKTTALWQVAWFRPATAVAVVALSLAFIFEINEVNNLTSTYADGDQATPADIPPDVFGEAADRAAAQIREAEATANRSSQNSGSDNPPSTDSAMTVDQASLLPVDQGCDTAQKSTMATWWKCIESLEKRGASQLAEQELSALVQAYPAFVEPNE